MSDADFVASCYWVLLGRAPDPEGRRAHLQDLRDGRTRASIVASIRESPEFRSRALAGQDADGAADAHTPAERLLAGFGSDADFVQRSCEWLLGETPPRELADGLLAQLSTGAGRVTVLAAIRASDRFRERMTELRRPAGRIPRDRQLCELANPAKWDNAEWMDLLRSLVVVPAGKEEMHRKGYEYTQLLFGLSRLGALDTDRRVLGVGAGHECVLYWLANRVRLVVGTDLYAGRWRSSAAAEGDERVLTEPETYAPFPYRRERLRFLKMDGRRLAFAPETFDVVYSLSSVEHFGGWDGARASVLEMARVLRPGGVLALATEWRLRGAAYPEVFAPEEVRRLVEVPGLALVEPIDDAVWSRYEGDAVDLERDRFLTPHMLVRIGTTVWTSVMMFLRKN